MDDPIIKRLLKETGNPELLETLVDKLSPTDLQSLLLAVARERASRLTPSDVLKQFKDNRFLATARVDPVQALAFDQLGFSILPDGYERLELSPLAPLGSVSALTPVSQYKVVSTIRNTEVSSDPTNVLALECALRRRECLRLNARSTDTVGLAASQRVVRAQPVEGEASFPHFRVFTLCTAGRNRGGYRFEEQILVEHIEYYLRLFDAGRDLGYKPGTATVTLAPFDPRCRPMVEAIIARLGQGYPGVLLEIDDNREAGRGYYQQAGFQIFVQDASGEMLLLVDGGFTDWTQQLLGSKKERLLISGLGSERFLFCFGSSGNDYSDSKR